METVTANAQDLERAVKTIIDHFVAEPDREGLKDTPRRYVKFLSEFLDPQPFIFTTFDAESYDEMIIETNIPFHSLCEHHLAPFVGTATIAYIPDGRIVGLSKLPRVLEQFARRFQNQERITRQTADFLNEKLQPLGVAVVIKAQHFCMSMRGVKKPHIHTTTSAMIGVFKEHAETRNEFLSLANAARS